LVTQGSQVEVSFTPVVQVACPQVLPPELDEVLVDEVLLEELLVEVLVELLLEELEVEPPPLFITAPSGVPRPVGPS
jgi:hypothetical protein